MTLFENGPAHGASVSIIRTPVFLRVTIDPDGNVDCLNNLQDEPAENESLHAYEIVGTPGMMHVSCSPRSKSFWAAVATYRYIPIGEQPDDRTLRSNSRWEQWVMQDAVKRPRL